MRDFDGVVDVFCGPETVVFLARGSGAPTPAQLRAALEEFEVVVDGVERDDARLF